MIPSLLSDTITPNIDRAAHYALLWGLEGLELRTVGRSGDRVPFVNESKIRARLEDADLPVTSVVPAIFEGFLHDDAARLNDIAQFQEILQFCRRLGCDRIVVSSFRLDDGESAASSGYIEGAVTALRRIGDRAAKSGVAVCVQNENGSAAGMGRQLGKLLDAVDRENVQAAWDPVEALRAGEEPGAGLEPLLGRVGLVRCRNAANTGNGWEVRSIDKGEIRWPDQLERIAASGFAGPVSLAVEAEPRAKVGLRDATTLIHWIRRLR